VKDWIERLLSSPDMLAMGHCQRGEDLNLGMGWIYYGLARLIRPRCAVVIGSWRGFAPLVLAKGLADNLEGGVVHFVEPSLVDDFWTDPARVDEHFRAHGVANVVHHEMTTQAFVESEAYAAVRDVGLLLVDGYHTAEQARFDYRSFESKLTPDAVILFHDSVAEKDSRMYGEDRRYRYSVCRFMDELKSDPALQVLDLPFAFGLTLVRSVRSGPA
jgi:hypothetical protein